MYVCLILIVGASAVGCNKIISSSSKMDPCLCLPSTSAKELLRMPTAFARPSGRTRSYRGEITRDSLHPLGMKERPSGRGAGAGGRGARGRGLATIPTANTATAFAQRPAATVSPS